MKSRIVLTGGGTAGHVTPNLALIDALKSEDGRIDYVGSEDGIEKMLVSEAGITYHSISSGKLRRYFSWQNFIDPLRILKGVWQSFWLLRRLKTNIVFSKGGYVAFPVVLAAWLNRIPVIAHESDMTPGLANRLSYPFVSKLCVTFDNNQSYKKWNNKVVETGTPIRQTLFKGDRRKGLSLCGFDEHKPCLLIMGGSQGAESINETVRVSIESLLDRYQLIHICGKGKIEHSLKGQSGYAQFEYAKEELAHFYAASDLVISRAGANSVFEILAMKKPHILIPLSNRTSRGDQIHNANYFADKGISVVIQNDSLNTKAMMSAIDEVEAKKEDILEHIQALNIESAVEKIIKLIKEHLHVKSKSTVG